MSYPGTIIKSFTAALLLGASLYSAPATARNASDNYHAVLMYAGYYIRGAVVCEDNSFVDVGVKAATLPELYKLSRAYPNIYKQWLGEGANFFNYNVMKYGLTKTCLGARKALNRR